MPWFTEGLSSLPAFLVIWSSATFIVNYIIALFRRDIDIIFPYISDTAAMPPESCIFGLMTFISACAGTATIYARYKFVEKMSEEIRVVSPRLNVAALVLGLLSCFGMCVVATFQETSARYPHDVGALIFFVCGVLYTILHSIISTKAFPYGSSITVCRFRWLLTTIATLAFFPTVICGYYVEQTILHRNTEDEDYKFHLASAICEWITAFSFIFFFLTYINEFKMFKLRVLTEYED